MRHLFANAAALLLLTLAQAQNKPKCRYTADGGGFTGPDDAAICTEAKVTYGYHDSIDVFILEEKTEMAGIRCCPLSSNSTTPAMSICADGSGTPLPCSLTTYKQAEKACDQLDMRLCTVNEVLTQPYDDMECGYEYAHVWTSEKADCPDIDEPELTCAAIVDGGGIVGADAGECPDATIEFGENPLNSYAAYVDTSVAGIHCCTLDGGPGPASCLEDCQTFTYSQAAETCVGQYRLCTADEILNGVLAGTDECKYNSMNVWSSDAAVCPTKVERIDVVFGEGFVELAGLTDGVNYVGDNILVATLNFRAVVAGKSGSVYFELADADGEIFFEAIENFAPYACFGDIGGTFAGNPGLLEWNTTYTLIAVPYVGNDLEPYTEGVPLTVTFSLLQDKDKMGPTMAPVPSPTASPSAAPVPVPTPGEGTVTAAPVPAPTLPPSLAPTDSPDDDAGNCLEPTLPADQVSMVGDIEVSPALYLVDTVNGHVVQELKDFPQINNRVFLHPDNDLSKNVVDVTGEPIPDVNQLTLVAAFSTTFSEQNVFVNPGGTATFVVYDNLNEVMVAEVTQPLTSKGYAGLYGDECGVWVSGITSGVYEVSVTAEVPSVASETVSRTFRIDMRENANVVPDENRPKKDTSGRLDVLDIVPFVQTPRVNNFNDRPFNKDKEKDRVEQLNRINFVMPGYDDGMVYVLMELTAVIYRCPGNQALTFEERTAQMELWFDLKTAVEEATGGARTVDLETRQHSGLRTMAWHPNYPENGLIYISYLEMWDDSLQPTDYLSIYEEVEDVIRAKADSVLAEFKVVDDEVIPSSYRPLFRIAYNETGADFAIYEHPIKECAFASDDPPYVIYCGSGDGSVDSSIAFGGRDKNAYGKILAIDVGNGEYTEHYQYGIPAVNVWGTGTDFSACCAADYRAETFAIGFRNPHRISFIKQGPYKGYGIVSEAGRDNGEEINILMGPGGDYGWMDREGHFIHLNRPGIGDGVDAKLPADDAKNGFIYPATFLGHNGLAGGTFTAQAIVGSHAIFTPGSDMDNRYFFSNFPAEAEVYYSMLDELMNATMMGPPEQLTMAPIYTTQLRYYANDLAYANNEPTGTYSKFNPIIKLLDGENLGPNLGRTDLRFGEGIDGELFIFSKRVGTVYIVKNSVPGVTALPAT